MPGLRCKIGITPLKGGVQKSVSSAATVFNEKTILETIIMCSQAKPLGVGYSCTML